MADSQTEEMISKDAVMLMAHLMDGNIAHTQAITDSLITNLDDDFVYARAERAAIRNGVMELMYGDHMPTPYAVERALYPTQAEVLKFVNPSDSIQQDRNKWIQKAGIRS